MRDSTKWWLVQSIRLLGFLAVLFLFGCEGALIKDAETHIPGKATVLGSVGVKVDGKPIKCGMMFSGVGKCTLTILRVGSDHAFMYDVSEDGSFSWNLEPGDYVIASYFVIAKGTKEGRLWISFSVPENQKVLYIGHLQVNLVKGMYSASVEDRYESSKTQFDTKLRSAGNLPLKDIMSPDPGVGTFGSVRYVCDEEWGINCTKKYRGVTPIYPPVSEHGFTAIEEVQPVFKWEPSTALDVTYDVVVHEAFRYSRDDVLFHNMPGAVVHYEQGVQVPFWRPSSPLKKDRRYYWSVRLRRGDTVSSWSRYGHFEFYLVAWSAGSGQWFSFSTPSK